MDGKTLGHVFLNRLALTPHLTAFERKVNKKYESILWTDVKETVLNLFHFLQNQNLKVGDRVGIFSNSRPEWAIADMANFCFGATTVPIYQSSSEDDLTYILTDSELKVLYVEDKTLLKKVLAVRNCIQHSIVIVGIDPNTSEFLSEKDFSWSMISKAVVEKDKKAVWEKLTASVKSLEPSTLASIVYTSGTTGQPKGATLAHSCMLAEMRAACQEFDLSPKESFLTFLPFAHVLGRLESLVPVFTGARMAFAESIASIPEDIKIVKPTCMISVPRIFEKINAKILQEVSSGPAFRRKVFDRAVQVAVRVFRKRQNQEWINPWLKMQWELADRVVLSKIREKLGGRLKFAISGGAPLAPELGEFFHAIGIKILEGYGLTETMAACAVNRPGDYEIGTVGKPFAQSNFKIAPDGEIWVKGPLLFKGYWNNPQATAEVMEDGWFKTGDIGEFTARGFLKITDRKKELIVTSGGKNVAPQKIENRIKQIPLISQCFLYGDKEKYLVALLTLNPDSVKAWAKAEGIDAPTSQLEENPKLIDWLSGEIKQINQELASYESVKKFKILPKDFTLETGELTPSLKMKRKVIVQKYNSQIRSMYEG